LNFLTTLVHRLSQGKRKIPLRLILVLPFSVQIFAAVGLTGYLSWRNSSQAVSELAGRLSQEIANQIEQHLETFADNSHLFLAFNATAAQTGTLDPTNLEQLAQSFWQQTQLTAQVKTLYFGSVEGNFLQIERGNPPTLSIRNSSTAPNWEIYQLDEMGKRVKLLQTDLYDPRKRPWYRAAVKADRPIWSPVYLFAEPPVLGITPARPVYNNNGKLLGVIAIDLTLEQIDTFLSSLEVGKSGQVFIVDRAGKMVASSDRDAIEVAPKGKQLNAIAHPNRLVREAMQQVRDQFGSLEISNLQQLSLKLQGQHYFVQAIPLNDDRGLDWLAIAMIPEADFMGQIRDNTRATVLLCVTSLGVAALLGIYTARRLSRPIRRLVQTSEVLAQQVAAAEDAGGESVDSPVPESRINEFGVLASSMNQMVGRLKHSQVQLEQKVEQRNEQLQRQSLHRLAAEAKFAKVFRSSPDPIAIASLKSGRFLEANDRFFRISGYSEEEVIGRTAEELDLWVTAEERSRVVRQFRRDKTLHNLETRFRAKSGEIRAVLLSAEIFELDGEPCVLYIGSDITARVAVQTALAEAEARYRSIFENAAEGIFQVTPAGKFLSVNPALAKMYGYESPEESIQHLTNVEQFYVKAADRERFLHLMAEQGKVSNFEYQAYRRDRKKIWVSENSRAVKDDAGNLLYYEGTIENITRRKVAEAALQEKERYLRLVLDNIPQQVFWKDRNSVFLGCNKNWADAAQLENPEAVVGLTDSDLLPPEVAARFREDDRRIMENNQPEFHTVETKQKRDKDGQVVWLDISKLPIGDEEGNVIGILGVLEDITRRKQAEEALRWEKERSEALLRNILPAAIANRLKQDTSSIAEQFDEVTILFADIVGFTPLSARMPATELVSFLNQIVSKFDELAYQHGLEKIKTIGDAYMVAGGLPVYQEDHAEAIAAMALDMQQSIAQVSTQGEPLQMRIGINTGPVVAGVIGVAKFIYDLWGDTVNVASRMESSGLAGKIQVTETTYRLLRKQYGFERRGTITVKGKGEMTTYWLTGRH